MEIGEIVPLLVAGAVFFVALIIYNIRKPREKKE